MKLFDILTAGKLIDEGGGGYPEPTGNVTITENGTYNVKDKARAIVNVPSYPEPTGTENITENGTYDIKNKAQAVVNVPGYPEPTGTENISANGTYDVKDKAQAVVNVPSYPEPTGTENISANGTYDIKDKAQAVVNVPNPSTGTLAITANGTYDVTDYAGASVAVADLYEAMVEGETSGMDLYSPAVSVRRGAFYGVEAKSISLPNCTSLPAVCFGYATLDDDLVLPQVQTIDEANPFSYCEIPAIFLPNLRTHSATSFAIGAKVQKIRMPKLETGPSGTSNFLSSSPVESIDFGSIASVPTLSTTVSALKLVAFHSANTIPVLADLSKFCAATAPIRAGSGFVLIARSLVDTMKRETNWAALASAGTQFLAIEDYTLDGTLSAALDEDKIDALLA